MANQIRLKRASGSDPGASDLVLGEPAVRTDTGEIFLKKDDGSIAKVAGGIDDGDKGDITVSNSGATFTIDSGVIDNANVASNAAIAGSKISPDFGSQNVATTGTLASSDITIQNSNPGIFLLDTNNNDDFSIRGSSGMFRIRSETDAADRLVVNSDGHVDIGGNLDVGDGLDVTGAITATGDLTITSTVPRIFLTDSNNNSDFAIANSNGVFKINDQTNSLTRLSIASDGTTTILQNLDVGAGVDVTGNITVSGTVDGRDVATDGSKLDGIASGATNVTNTNQLTNGAGFITATLTNEQVQDIVGNMVTGNTESGITVTYQDSDGTLDFVVGTLNQNTTGTSGGFTAGNASNLNSGTIPDARIPDVITPATRVSTVEVRTSNGQQLVLNAGESQGKVSGQTGEYVYVNAEGGLSVNTPDSANPNWVGGTASDQTLITGTAITIDGNTVFHQGNDGAGSGLDADTLDGIQGSAFLRSDANDTMTGNLTLQNTAPTISLVDTNANDDFEIKVNAGNFAINDATNSVNRFLIDSSGTVDIAGTVTSPTVSVTNGILELKAAIATSHTLTADYNAIAVDPTINNGITVTVPSGAVWAIV